ncbi:MAG: polymer-forming cytoskeletal protein [Gammaproteobacteria bacterium]|nr:polymer-forming cytoskeletal protein [Gammaproteobacteria bacterium]
MFGSKENSHTSSLAHTLVSETTQIAGDIHFKGELIIEGRVEGNIYAEDDSGALLRVAEKGAVEGNICVPSVIINGLVRGDVRSAKHVELAAKAVVVGNVYYNLMEMVMGSEINGSLVHSVASEKSKQQPEPEENTEFAEQTTQSSSHDDGMYEEIPSEHD